MRVGEKKSAREWRKIVKERERVGEKEREKEKE